MESHQSSSSRHAALEPSQAEIAHLLALFTQQHYIEAKACADQLTVRFPQHGFTWKALGAIHKKLGNADDAIAALHKATLYLPTDADTHYNLGNSFLGQNRFADAQACYQQALTIQPAYLAAHYNLGKAYQGQDQLEAAEASFRAALALQPALIEALSSLGVVLHTQKKYAESEACLRRTLAINPHDPSHHTNLANVLVDLDKLEEAESLFRTTLRISPNSWQPLYNLANLLRKQKRLDEAESLLVQLVQLRPDFAEAWFDLGNCLFAQHRHGEATIAYREALRIDPQYAEAHNHHGIALKETGRLDDAEQSYRAALLIKPDYKEVHNNLGNVLRELDRIPEAEACFKRALEIDPGYTEAHNNLGIALKAAGRLEEARQFLEQAIALNPDFLEPHFGLATLKTYGPDDPHIEQLEKQLVTVSELKPEAQIRFWFAIGKMYEDLGRVDDSFSAYQRGNTLKFNGLDWDERKETAFVNHIKDVFGPALFERASLVPPANLSTRNDTNLSRTPIFIVGMPRSGTSLLEQILSTHPGVFGAGELMTLNEVIVQAMPEHDYRHYPKAIEHFSAAQLQQMGAEYLDRVWQLAPQSTYITDKMPSNFLHLGMIHLMFPNAKIIHAMRDPMDSCFSNYSRLFNKNNIAFSYDLRALGHYYNRYIDLMAHWHEVLPAGTILDCRYEKMVEDTEAQAKRVLEYIGLPWDERCLDFHKNKRRVKTASQAQVQKPIYTSSVARWKPYEKYLDPLAELIRQSGQIY